MQLTLNRPDYSSPKWEALTHELRADVLNWLEAFSNRPERGVTNWLREVGESMGVSYQTARRKYDALVKSQGDWTALIDNRKTPASWKESGAIFLL